MQEVEPYQSKMDLISAIDNGGRFYNLFSRAKDSIVSAGELAKAAGTWASDQNAFLFLDLAKYELSESDSHSVINILEPSLRQSYLESPPRMILPSQIDTQCRAGDAILTQGTIEHQSDKTQFSGFIYIPITVGDVTTFTMTPIFQCFDVFRIFDSTGDATNAVIAVPLNSDFSDGDQIRFAGYLRELEFNDEKERTNNFYLEANYFSRLKS